MDSTRLAPAGVFQPVQGVVEFKHTAKDEGDEVLAGVTDLLKQKMKPETFRRARYWWWYRKIYLPHRALSTVVRASPVVEGQPSALLDKLRKVNVFASTSMCRVMSKYGSDKGNGWHNYTAAYSDFSAVSFKAK